MLFFKHKIWSKYTPKRTKLHHLKKFSRGGGACPRTPLAKRGAKIHPANGMYIQPNIIPPCLNMDLRPWLSLGWPYHTLWCNHCACAVNKLTWYLVVILFMHAMWLYKRYRLFYCIIDLFLRPCLCYQLQSIEQNMYVLL